MTIHTINWGDLTPALFLRDYWQKKPLLIKNAFNDFQDTITADELAGLAMESEIESRIVSQKQQSHNDIVWQVDHGPFEDFSIYGEQDWTLLVQAVNNWSRVTDDLLKAFKFIPRWRIDDVMVSFSTPNGSVGAHLDQYDVFIIQGSGKRRWQVGCPDQSLKTLLPHPDLKQVSEFAPIIDEITESGDLLYIPPHHPHHGVAIENAMNFSIGFQAPSAQALWSGFADQLIDNNQGVQCYLDPQLTITEQPALISKQDKANLKTFMLEQLNNDILFEQFIGKYLTQSHHTLEILIPVEALDITKLEAILAEPDITLTPVSGLKSAIVTDNKPYLFVNGEGFDLNKNNFELAKVLADNQTLLTEEIIKNFNLPECKALLLLLLNKGYWYVA